MRTRHGDPQLQPHSICPGAAVVGDAEEGPTVTQSRRQTPEARAAQSSTAEVRYIVTYERRGKWRATLPKTKPQVMQWMERYGRKRRKIAVVKRLGDRG